MDDTENQCFICNLEKDVFVKQNVSFKLHREADHNLWVYTYFLVSLLNSDPDEMNGIQSYIYSKYQKEELGWLPAGRAICFDDEDADKNDGLEDKIEGILSKIKSIEGMVGEDDSEEESTNDEEN